MFELLWNIPLSEAKMAQIMDSLALGACQRVLDVGCGCGEVLIRLYERFQIQGIGIDKSPDHVAEAVRRADGRVTQSAVRFFEGDAQSYAEDPGSFDMAMCMGSTHAFGLGSGAYRNAVRQMMSVVAPGGLVLVADGYLKRPATPEYRKILGDSLPDEMTHAANVATGTDLGLIPLAAWTSNEDEWDDFEWTYQRIVQRNAEGRPDDERAKARLVQRRQWMQAYLQWGRETLGFGVYLFQRPRD